MKSIMLRTILLICFMLNGTSAWANPSKAPEIDFDKIKESPWDAFKNLENLEHAYISSRPKKRKDGIKVGKLKNPEAITELAQDLASGKYAKYDSLLITHNNKLVFESYFNRGRVNMPHPQASATKGYTALAIGRAIQLGYLSMDDLHKPVLAFLNEVDQANLAPGTKNLTLHHSLSMQSGIRIDEAKLNELMQNPDALRGQQLAQAYLTHSDPITEHTQQYLYQSIDPHITMLVLDAVVPGSAREFIFTELFDKLGIHQNFWDDNVSGVPEGAHSSLMTSRDMTKLGKLVKDKGVWKGKQLIPAEYIEQATGSVATPQSPSFDYTNFRYGYYFWGKSLSVAGQDLDLKLAWGGGGQFVVAVDKLDLVIAVTARTHHAEALEFIETRILPSFIDQDAIKAKAAAHDPKQKFEQQFAAFQLPKVRVIPIKDSSFGGQYELYVKLPNDYFTSDKHYPVIYFTDAVFEIEMLSSTTEFMLEDVILVGISWQKDMEEKSLRELGEFASRFRDYTVREDENPEIQEKYQPGKASRHLKFFRNDVIPYVEEHFRTDEENRAYFGFSLGAKFGIYTLLKEPSTFKHYLLGSPGIRGQTPYFSELISKIPSGQYGLNANVFLSYGSLETDLGKENDKLIKMLNERSDESLSLTFKVIDGDHSTVFPETNRQAVEWLSKLIH
jgi:predicted alpha/beta superfamily hydrolase/CubicO group peptidase (beta-lactamase class C family)